MSFSVACVEVHGEELCFEYRLTRRCLVISHDSDTGYYIAICNVVSRVTGEARWEIYLFNQRFRIARVLPGFSICITYKFKYLNKRDYTKNVMAQIHFCVPILREDLYKLVRPTTRLIETTLRTLLRRIIEIIRSAFVFVDRCIEEIGYSFLFDLEYEIGMEFHSDVHSYAGVRSVEFCRPDMEGRCLKRQRTFEENFTKCIEEHLA